MDSELPFAFHAASPDAWEPALADDPASGLTADQCVIGRERWFARGLLQLAYPGWRANALPASAESTLGLLVRLGR